MQRDLRIRVKATVTVRAVLMQEDVVGVPILISVCQWHGTDFHREYGIRIFTSVTLLDM